MKRILACAALALSFASTSIAAPLNPGSVVFPGGADFADPVHGGAQLVINDNLIDFRLDPTPQFPLNDVGGNIQNRVTRRVTMAV